MTTYLNDLNPRQKAGVEATHGPVLVIAGAGSGKTKMLTSRIVHLMAAHNIPGHNILAVTFTNKAAGEMRSRVSLALGLSPDALEPPPPYLTRASQLFSQPTIGTFHSICVRLLRREIERTPYKGQFVIYDDGDQLALIKDCFAKLNLSEKTFSPKSFQHSINQAKCQAIEAHEMPGGSLNPYTKNLVNVYTLYQQELAASNAIDFGEIITLTYKILRDNPDLLEKYQQLYQYIHVDEYQDTNRAQYLLVKLLASKHRNICVVGDEDQSIYKWRGADIRNILDFEKDYPEAQIVKLEQNYRSTQTIINASSKLISNNTSRKAKTLWTDNATGEKIQRIQLSDDKMEAEFAIHALKNECQNQGYAFSDVAIFYRTNAQSRVFEDVLRREKIPYKIVGGLKFYDRKEIKDMLAYFRSLTNSADSIGLKRIINVPQRSIGKATVEKIEAYGFQRAISFEQALSEVVNPSPSSATNSEVLAGAARRKVGEFVSLLEDLRGEMRRKTLSEFYHELLDRTHYVEELKQENTEESLARIENLQEFDSILIEFENDQLTALQAQDASAVMPTAETLMPLFLETITLVGEQEAKESEAGSVLMMTLHTSKGLEFPLVFMVGMEEGLFPSIRPYEEETEEDIEEERRLCYVGMTRAKRKLYMSHAICRRIYGNIVYQDPARFFLEIPEEFVQFTDFAKMRSGAGQTSGSGGRNRYINDDDEYEMSSRSRSSSTVGVSVGASQIRQVPLDPNFPSVGRRVRHGTYGMGIVRLVEGTTPEAKVTVEFSNRQTKKFILKFANLELVDGASQYS